MDVKKGAGMHPLGFHTASKWRVYLPAALCCAAFFVSGMVFIHTAMRRAEQKTLEYVEAIMRCTQFAVEEHISERFTALYIAVALAEDSAKIADGAALAAAEAVLFTHNEYVRFGMADRAGNVSWVSGDGKVRQGSLASVKGVERALAGEQALTEPRWIQEAGLYANYYAVPLVRDGAVVGAAFAAIPESEIQNVIENSLYVRTGYAHIIRDDGSYVVTSTHPGAQAGGTGVFDNAPQHKAYKEKALADMAGRKTGYMEHDYGPGQMIEAYVPLSINGWYLFYVVPKADLRPELNIMANGTVALIAGTSILFILLLLLVRHVNNKGQAELERMVFEDPLTKASSYQKFLLDAERLVANSKDKKYAVYYGDITNFKYINDLFGRDTGDRLLRYWAQIGTQKSRPEEAFARVNADIFVALRRYDSMEDIVENCEKGGKQMADFPETMRRGYRVEQSCGVYVLNELDGPLTIEDMVYRANVAQKSIKGSDKRYALYSDEMRQRKLWETEVESKMEAALANNEFKMYLQPKINICSGDTVAGAEALVRWILPENGVIPPAQFIPLFERNGFIVKLDRKMFENVCKWYQSSLLEQKCPGLRISVNVSRIGILQPGFVAYYTETKKKYGIPDDCLELEFTESMVMENQELFKVAVSELHKNGFRCSLDDFGSGYSSLNILRTLAVDTLKLDQLFFRCEDDTQRCSVLVKNVIRMAKDMEMEIVAEGVETAGQVEELRAMGCDIVQGYVFARPIPFDEFLEYADAQSRKKRPTG